jgi:hypothetical protein
MLGGVGTAAGAPSAPAAPVITRNAAAQAHQPAAGTGHGSAPLAGPGGTSGATAPGFGPGAGARWSGSIPENPSSLLIGIGRFSFSFPISPSIASI